MYSISLDAAEKPLDGRQLDRLIERWLEETAAGVTPYTLAGYRQKIAHFQKWWTIAAPPLDYRLTKKTLAQFGRWLSEQPSAHPPHNPLSHGQQHDVLRRLAQMFRWAKAKGYTEIDHSDWLPAPMGEPTRRTAPTLGDLAKLMQAADLSATPERDRAILAFLIGTGARRAEAATLQIEDIQINADASGIATVTGKRTRANRSGRHAVAFDRDTGAYLIAYLDADPTRTHGPLFVSETGEGLSNQTIYRVVKRAIERADLGGKIAATHDLRRAFATHLARHARADPTLTADMIRRQLGQASYRTTAEHYTLLDAEDLLQSVISPLTMERERRAEAKQIHRNMSQPKPG
jgi:site-specific recombinase XerD